MNSQTSEAASKVAWQPCEWMPEFIPPWDVESVGAVRERYDSGFWAYALGKPAIENPRYQEACEVAVRDDWNPWWIRTYQDIEAVLNEGAYFSHDEAMKAVHFIERLKLTKGRKWAGKLFKLLDWQKYDFVMPLFGWQIQGFRRFIQAQLWIPKKNGKSELAAAIALYMLYKGDIGAECYIAAWSRDQASIIYRECGNMISWNETLNRKCKTVDTQKLIRCAAQKSFLKALAGEASAKGHEGLDWQTFIFDELHVQEKRILWDTIYRGGASRDDSLLLTLSTAGEYNKLALGYEQWNKCKILHACQNETGEPYIEPRMFALMYAAPKDEAALVDGKPVLIEADWRDFETARRANPSMGITISDLSVKTELNNAKRIPVERISYRRYKLNQWMYDTTAWVAPEVWEQCNYPLEDPPWRTTAYGAFDLSSVDDLTAVALAFNVDNRVQIKMVCFAPAECLEKRQKDDGVPYMDWAEAGWITTCPGASINYDMVENCILTLNKQYKIASFGYDKWHATQLVQSLLKKGVKMVEIIQGPITFTPIMKYTQKLALDGHLAFGGNPVLEWGFKNLIVRQNNVNQNIQPDKGKSKEKIDPAVAAMMAIDRMMRDPAPVEWKFQGAFL